MRTSRTVVTRCFSSSSSPVSRYGVASLQHVSSSVREQLQQLQDKAGFLPNIFSALAVRPAELEAFVRYHDTLMADRSDSRVSRVEREMIVVATSAANSCLYCVVAHGAILRVYAKQPHLAEAVALDWRNSHLVTPMQRAMLAFACKIAGTPPSVEQHDMDELLNAGWTKEEAWHIASIVAFFALSNRMAHFLALKPNDEFYTMGRIPKQKQ